MKRDIENLKKKILSVDGDLKKQSAVSGTLKRDFETISYVRDTILEKKQILESTYATLKRDVHSRKQNHKMSLVSQMLKKKRDQNMSFQAESSHRGSDVFYKSF